MELLETMIAAAREAGAFMLGAGDLRDQSSQKTNSKDFVTVADIKAQDILRDRLRAAFPDAAILSEEDPEEARALLYGPRFTGFVLDPIDGTYNFKRDMRESAISVGYVIDGASVAGVIFDPYRDELFAAEQGRGVTRNGKSIVVSKQTDLESASVATSNSYDSAAMADNLTRHMAIYKDTGIMPWTSCPGSGVLIMAWIACGRIDAYHHNGLKPWDNAAAFCIVKEAGGVVYDLRGIEPPFTTSSVLIGTPEIVSHLQQVFKKLPEELLS